ncbi:MAG: hypothetical protein LKF58_04860 [Bacilli bacterium]|nr:hypothetical protein [Bacilli bacterium]MCH4211080.1 hypothetical protein [Bacilli bacterium]MCH4277677.1 hypothetical protein [Bacilli bacterium]MCI2055340.1 hypothetical protein [Bacilli bacterium]
MKKLLRNPLKERKLSDLLSLIMGVLFMIAAIIYVILGNGDRNYSSNVMIMALVSGIAMILGMFVSFSEIRFASALLFIAASGIQCYYSAPTITDIFNEVVYYGGSHFNSVFFLVLFLSIGILACLYLFFDGTKGQKKAKEERL